MKKKLEWKPLVGIALALIGWSTLSKSEGDPGFIGPPYEPGLNGDIGETEAERRRRHRTGF